MTIWQDQNQNIMIGMEGLGSQVQTKWFTHYFPKCVYIGYVGDWEQVCEIRTQVSVNVWGLQ